MSSTPLWANLLVYLIVAMAALIPGRLAALIFRGVEAARRPEHRVTPETPWGFFWKFTRRQLIVWSLLWIVTAAGMIAIFFFLARHQSEPAGFKLITAMILPSVLLGFTGLVLAAGLIWAPCCRSLAVYLGLCYTVAIPAYIGLFVLGLAAFPRFLRQYNYLYSTPNSSGSTSANIFFISILPIILAVVSGVVWRVRRLGTQWFRLDN